MKKNDYYKTVKLLLTLIAIYVLIIARGGYEYGRNDNMQLSYSVFLHNNSLYPTDLYIQQINSSIPNERFFFSSLLSFFSELKYVAIIGHFVFCLLLFFAIEKISVLFIKKIDGFRWLVPIFLFAVLYDINLGGNELYYNNFFVSPLANSISLWGVYYFLKGKNHLAFVLIALATFFHPIIGIQLFIIFSAILFINAIISKKIRSLKQYIYPVLFYLLTGGLWVIWLKLNFSDKQLSDNQELFDIFFRFRNSHHYLPSYFPVRSYLIIVPLNIFGLIYFYKKNIKIFLFYTVVIVLSIIFTIGVEKYNSIEIASFQWFKSTIWLKLFSLIAVFAFAEKYFTFLSRKVYIIIYKSLFYFITISFLFLIIFKSEKIPFKVYFDYGKQLQADNAVTISIEAKNLTNKDALFVQPLRFTELKFYARRSSFVDFKTPVHRKAAIGEWYKRLTILYGLDYHDFSKSYNPDIIADNYYKSLNEEFFRNMKNEYGLTHILTFKDHILNFTIVTENEQYIIYKI